MACGSELGARGLDGRESAGIRFRERREKDHQTPYRVNSERAQRAGARCIEQRDPSARARCRASGPGTESAGSTRAQNAGGEHNDKNQPRIWRSEHRGPTPRAPMPDEGPAALSPTNVRAQAQ